MRVSNLTDFTLELAGTPGTNRRQLFVTGTYGNSAKLMSSIFEISNRTVQALSVPGMTYSLSFQPMPTAITSKAASRGGNSLGLTGAEGNLFTLLLTVSWDSVADDERIAQELLADEKERAEHVMLVDLGRNDLGRVCEYGSVNVDTFMSIETYSTLMHIVSNVSGELRDDVGAMDALRDVGVQRSWRRGEQRPMVLHGIARPRHVREVIAQAQR